MTANANPVELIGGMTTLADVSKSDFVAWAKAHVTQVLANADAVRNTDLSGQLIITLKGNGRIYALDTADTTTEDDGDQCIIDAEGNRFKLSIIGLNFVRVMGDVSAVRSSDLSGQLAILIAATGKTYFLDPSDTTTADDGASCIVDDEGNRFKIASEQASTSAARARVVDVTGGDPASAYAAGQTVDGKILSQGDIVLRATPSGDVADGVYGVPASGAASRLSGFAAFDDLPGVAFAVMEGDNYANTTWRCTSESGGTIGTDALQFKIVTATQAGTSDVGKDIRINSFGATILVPPSRYRVGDYLPGGVASGDATKDTAAFNAAVAAAVADGGLRIIELPYGTLAISSSIHFDNSSTNKCALIGQGRGRSIIAANFTNDNDIVLGNPTAAYGEYVLSDFTLQPSVTKTNGYAVLVNDAQRSEIDIEILGGFRGIGVENGNDGAEGDEAVIHIYSPLITGLSDDGLVFGTFSNLYANGVWVYGGIIAQCQNSVTINRASGLHFIDVETYQAGGNSWNFAPVGIGIQGIFCKGCLADSPTGVGWMFTSNGSCSEIYLTSCQASSAGSHGLKVESTVGLHVLQVTDMLNSNNGEHGAYIGGGASIGFRGGQYAQNGVTSGTGAGIAIDNGVKEFSVNNVFSGYVGHFRAGGVTRTQKYGVLVAGSGSDRFDISHNHFVQNITSGLQDNSSGSNKITTPNLTY